MSRRRSMRLRSGEERTEEEERTEAVAAATEKELPRKRKRRSAVRSREGESGKGECEKGESGCERGKRQRRRESTTACEQEYKRANVELEQESARGQSCTVRPSSRALLVSSSSTTGNPPEEAPLVVDQEALDALEDVTERQLGENELLNIVDPPPSPRPERDPARKAVFASDLVDMMYGKGDERHPRKESIALMDAIVQEFIEDMMRSTVEEVTSQKATSNMNETDLLFRVRHDQAKFERAVYLLKVSREVKQIKNAWKLQTSVSDDEDESLFT